MNQSPYITSDLKKLPSEDIAYCMSRFNRAKDADDPHRQRCVRNMRSYTSIDQKQWNDKTLADMKREGRDPDTFNFMQLYVDGVAGNYIMNSTDPKFIDREDDTKDAQEGVEALQKVYFSDKEHGDFTAARNESIVNGLIYRGVEEIVVRKPSNNPREWRVGFDSIRPDLISFDPSNTSDNIARNSNEAWKTTYLTLNDMIMYTNAKEGELANKVYRKAIEAAKNSNDPSMTDDFDTIEIDSFENLDRFLIFGNRYQVVEWYHLEREKKSFQIYTPMGMRLPDTGRKYNTQEDRMAKMEWALANGFMLSDDTVKEFTDYETCLYLTSYCPELGEILTDGKDIRQLDHLPFYTWSFVQKGGISIGLVDFLYDAQDTLNKREAAKTKVIVQGSVRKAFYHPEAFGNDATKIRGYIDNANDVSKPVELDQDATPGMNYFGLVPGAEVNAALFQDEGMMIQFLNEMSRLPPAMRGMASNSADSGIAIGRKVIEGTIMQRMPSETLRNYENQKSSDYAVLAPIIYGGPINYNRKFGSSNGKDSIIINEHVGYDDSGNDIVRKNLRDLKRVDVIIIESKQNDYIKQANREMDIAALQAMPPSQTNTAIRTSMECNLVRNMDFTDTSQKEEVEEICKATMAMVKKNLIMQNKQLDMQINPPPSPPPSPTALTPENIQAATTGAPLPAGPEAPVENRQAQGRPELPPVNRIA